MPAVSSKKSQKNAVKEAKKRKMPPPKPVEEESGSEESEEEAPVPVAKKGKKVKKVEPPAKKAKKEESESEDGSSDEEESEEETPVIQNSNGKKAVNAPKKESSDEEESDDEGSDEEEEEVKAVAEEEEEDSDDEAEAESSDDAEDSDDEEMETAEEVVNTLYIGGLPKDMEEAKIVKMFKKKGVEFAAIRRPGKKSIVYADLAEPDHMEVALALNGTEMKGHTVKVEKANPPKEQVEAKEKNNKKNKAEKTSPVKPKPALEDKSELSLFVKNLDWGVTEQQLMELFEGCYEVFLPEQDGRKKGFGYVRYGSDQSDLMNQHMSDLQGSELNGRAIFIDKATPRVSTPGGRGGARGGGRGGARGGGGGGGSFNDGPSKTLIVKSLSFDTTWQSLKDAFDGCSHSRVCTDRDSGRSRGFGFVEYDSVELAQSAMDSMNNQDVDGRTVSVNFAADRGSFTPRGGGRGGGGDRGFTPRGRGGRGGGGGFRGRGAPRGGRGGFHQASGKKTTFNDSD